MMDVGDALNAIALCMSTAAELVETTQLECKLIADPTKILTLLNFKESGRRISDSLKRLERSASELDAIPADVWGTINDASLTYQPFLWRGHTYHPATIVLSQVAADLMDDAHVFETWFAPEYAGLTDEERVRDCRHLLEKWPSDLPVRLRMLRGQLDHEAQTILAVQQIKTSTDDGPTAEGIVIDGILHRITQSMTLRLVTALWNRPDRSMTFGEASAEVWRDAETIVTEGMAKRQQKNANNALASSPLSVSISDGVFILKDDRKSQ